MGINVNKSKRNSFWQKLNRRKDKIIIFLLLAFSIPCFSQDEIAISPADSLSFSDSVKIWSFVPRLDSMPDWQVNTAIAVFTEKINKTAAKIQPFSDSLTLRKQTAEEAVSMAQSDTTVTKETIKSLKESAKLAGKDEKPGKSAQKEAASAISFAEKVQSMDSKNKKKNLPKLYKQANHLQNTWETLSTPKPVAVPDPPKTEEPITTQIENPPALPPADTTATTVAGNEPMEKPGDNKKKKKEKAPEKPSFAKYDPKKDVMLNPPKAPCTLSVNRRDEFTGNVYREMPSTELFRFTNAVMKKVLPPQQPHILCKAALASDANGGMLLLSFTIKDQNARRTFGGLAPKSIVSLKFINGEIMTLFNESSQEVKYDPEQGTATFVGQYPFQAGVFKKLEKLELDQIRVAWSTGYEDYNVQQVGLLQQQASCLK